MHVALGVGLQCTKHKGPPVGALCITDISCCSLQRTQHCKLRRHSKQERSICNCSMQAWGYKLWSTSSTNCRDKTLTSAPRPRKLHNQSAALIAQVTFSSCCGLSKMYLIARAALDHCVTLSLLMSATQQQQDNINIGIERRYLHCAACYLNIHIALLRPHIPQSGAGYTRGCTGILTDPSVC